MRISAVIPARNDAQGLPFAVASLRAQDGVDLDEIIVAVGPSTDETMSVASSLVDDSAHAVALRVIENPSGRTPDALNLAIAEATGEVIARVDARSVLPSGYLASAVETMQRTGARNVGAVQWPVGVSPTQRAIAAAMRSKLGSGAVAYRHATEAEPVDTAYLGFFDAAALREVGGYDTTFTRNQDAELNARLNAAGHQVWVDPRMVVEYAPRASLRKLASQYWQYGWWRARTLRKHPQSRAARQLVPPLAVLGLVAALGVGIVTPWALLIPAAYVVAMLIAGALAGDTPAERALAGPALVVMQMSWGAGLLCSTAAAVVRR